MNTIKELLNAEMSLFIAAIAIIIFGTFDVVYTMSTFFPGAGDVVYLMVGVAWTFAIALVINVTEDYQI